MRATVDHNVWVRALLSPGSHSAQVLDCFINRTFRNVTSMELVDELAEVLQKRRVAALGITLEDSRQFRALILRGSELVWPENPVAICRDPDDDHLIAVAAAGRVQVLATYDADLHAQEVRDYLRGFGTEVVTAGQMLASLVPREPSE